jgi:hypothetical protein
MVVRRGRRARARRRWLAWQRYTDHYDNHPSAPAIVCASRAHDRAWSRWVRQVHGIWRPDPLPVDGAGRTVPG